MDFWVCEVVVCPISCREPSCIWREPAKPGGNVSGRVDLGVGMCAFTAFALVGRPCFLGCLFASSRYLSGLSGLTNSLASSDADASVSACNGVWADASD